MASGEELSSYRKTYEGSVASVAAGASQVFDARGMAVLNVIAGSGGTVTVSRVDSATASADTTSLVTTFPHSVDWPFFRVSAATADARVGLV